MKSKNQFINKSRLREYIRKYTKSEYLVDLCMLASASLIGFYCENEADFYKEDRAFMKKLKRVPNDLIDNCSIWFGNRFARIEGPRIIKLVKEDLRGIA